MLLALTAFLLAAISLFLGWSLGNETWVRPKEGYDAMVPSTVVSFCVLSLATLMSQLDSKQLAKRSFMIATLVIAFVLINGAVRILLDPQGIDGLLLTGLDESDHMSSLTIAGFVLAGLGTRGLARQRLTDSAPRQTMYASLVGLSSALALMLMNGWSPQSLAHLAAAQGLSLYTTALFAVIFLAQILVSISGDAFAVESD